MTTHKKVSVLPIYLIGFVWLGYALIFPLHSLLHYILCAGPLTATAAENTAPTSAMCRPGSKGVR